MVDGEWLRWWWTVENELRNYGLIIPTLYKKGGGPSLGDRSDGSCRKFGLGCNLLTLAVVDLQVVPVLAVRRVPGGGYIAMVVASRHHIHHPQKPCSIYDYNICIYITSSFGFICLFIFKFLHFSITSPYAAILDMKLPLQESRSLQPPHGNSKSSARRSSRTSNASQENEELLPVFRHNSDQRLATSNHYQVGPCHHLELLVYTQLY